MFLCKCVARGQRSNGRQTARHMVLAFAVITVRCTVASHPDSPKRISLHLTKSGAQANSYDTVLHFMGFSILKR
ncbi:hypothetical protein C0J52_01015 [Blattella germanica]|nr:hypothetical protein C0J52_01015 [Blattella germanica]